MEVHIRELEAGGFKITRKAGGHPTSFVAEWSLGSGGPKIGILGEYDALPGLGNAPEPLVKPAANGKTEGQACGHNNLGAGCTGAAFALKAMMTEKKVPGTIRMYGCGAEENMAGKVFMAKAGLFDDLDAAITWHPTPLPAAGNAYTTAFRSIRISWKGQTAYAGTDPWNGRSALDAAGLFTHGLNLMREHIEPTARMHYMYEAAGVAPNIVPDEATLYMMAREGSTPNANAMTEWLRQLAKGAALGTQTKATFDLAIGLAELIPNETLALRTYEHLQNTPWEWTAEEQAFAKACQKGLGVKELGMPTAVVPFVKELRVGGSTDVWDVSWIAPTLLFGAPTYPIGVSAHTWAVTACGGMSIGDKGTVAAAEILAAVGYELLTEPDFLKAAKEEWIKRVAGRKYEAVLNIDPTTWDEVAKRFCKGPGEEYITGIGEK